MIAQQVSKLDLFPPKPFALSSGDDPGCVKTLCFIMTDMIPAI